MGVNPREALTVGLIYTQIPLFRPDIARNLGNYLINSRSSEPGNGLGVLGTSASARCKSFYDTYLGRHRNGKPDINISVAATYVMSHSLQPYRLPGRYAMPSLNSVFH